MYGAPPFYNKDHEIMFKDIQKRPVFFDDSKAMVSKGGKDIILKLLNKNPIMRLGAGGSKEIK